MSGKLPPSLFAPRKRLDQRVAPLKAISSRWVLAVVAPVVLTVLVITAGYVAAGGDDPGFPPQFPTLVYGGANVVVLCLLVTACNTEQWRATALFRRPSRAELTAGVLAAGLGVVVGWPATTVVTDALDVARYATPSLTTTVGIATVGFGAVVVAPVAEEILYRGLLVGIGLERGYSPLTVGAGSLLLFATIHVFTAGIAGIVNAFLLGAVLTWLRLRFDNLVGAWLFHALNNLLEFLVALSLVPSLYAF